MAAAGENEGNRTISEWSGTRGQRPMSLDARPHEQLSVGGTMGVLLSCQRHPEVSLGLRPAGVGMRKMACIRSWSRAAASGAYMSSCQQLERLRLDRVCESSCWIYLVHIYTHIHSHCWALILLSPRGEQDEDVGAVFVQLVCVSGWSVQLALVCGTSLCPLWLLSGNLLSLAAGWTWGHAAVAASLSHTGLPHLVWFP